MPSRVHVVPVAAALLLAVAAAACTDPTHPAPVGPITGSQTAPAVPRDANGFVVPTKPGTIYVAPDSIYRQSQGYPGNLASRLVLFDDGTFVLDFAWSFGYTGRYTRAGSVVTFDWDGWSAAGPWGATGVIRGDEIALSFNVIMQLTDFMDGTYRRAR